MIQLLTLLLINNDEHYGYSYYTRNFFTLVQVIASTKLLNTFSK